MYNNPILLLIYSTIYSIHIPIPLYLIGYPTNSLFILIKLIVFIRGILVHIPIPDSSLKKRCSLFVSIKRKIVRTRIEGRRIFATQLFPSRIETISKTSTIPSEFQSNPPSALLPHELRARWKNSKGRKRRDPSPSSWVSAKKKNWKKKKYAKRNRRSVRERRRRIILERRWNARDKEEEGVRVPKRERKLCRAVWEGRAKGEQLGGKE